MSDMSLQKLPMQEKQSTLESDNKVYFEINCTLARRLGHYADDATQKTYMRDKLHYETYTNEVS